VRTPPRFVSLWLPVLLLIPLGCSLPLGGGEADRKAKTSSSKKSPRDEEIPSSPSVVPRVSSSSADLGHTGNVGAQSIYAEVSASHVPGPAAAPGPDAVARARPYQRLLFGQAAYQQRKRILLSLHEDPAPDAETALIIVLQTRADPLSVFAIEPLVRTGSENAKQALRTAVADPRDGVASAALLACARLGVEDAGELCRTRLQSSRSYRMRMAAAYGLAEVRAAGARELLRRTMREDLPAVRLAAAWALATEGDRQALRFLRGLAVSEEPGLAHRAVWHLRALNRPANADAFIGALGSRHETVWTAAFEALEQMPIETVQAARILRSRVVEEEHPRVRRRGALLRIAWMTRSDAAAPRSAEAWRELLGHLRDAALEGTDPERRVLVRVVSAWADPMGIGPLLLVLREGDDPARSAADKALRTKARRHAPRRSLPESASEGGWRRWWLRTAEARWIDDPNEGGGRILVVRAVDGVDRYAAPGAAIAPGVDIVRVDNARGELVAMFRNKHYAIPLQERATEVNATTR
jgi:HEAT repeat protein